MSRRRWPPPPIVEEEIVSLTKEIGYERYVTDEYYVPARGTINQGPVMVEVYPGPGKPEYHGLARASSGTGSELDIGSSDLNDSPAGDRGRQVDSSLLDDDSIASTIFTHRSPSPYAYTQSSSSPRSCHPRDNYHGRVVSLDDGVADLVRSYPSSPISPIDKDSKPFELNNSEINQIGSRSESDCSCYSSCSECEDEVYDGTYRSTNLQAGKCLLSEPSSKRRYTESKVRVPASSPINDRTTRSDNGTRWASSSSRSRTLANRSTSQTRPELRLSTPNGRKGSPARADWNPDPPIESIISRRPSRPGHQHSWSCNGIPQSPKLDKPKRVIDYGGIVDGIRGHSANLSPITSPKSRSSHDTLLNESDGITSTYHSRYTHQRRQWPGSPVSSSEADSTAQGKLPSTGSPLSARPFIRKVQNSFRTGANAGTPQIIVQPPAEENVPVASAFAEDDAAQSKLHGPGYSFPKDEGKRFSRKESSTYCTERPTCIYPDNFIPPKMARSYSDDPWSGPRSTAEPNFRYDNLNSLGDSFGTISPPTLRNRPDSFVTETEDFYSGYDATPLPPCPRTDHVPYDDWFVLKGTPSLVTCPGCIQNIVPPYERHRFVRALPSSAGPTTICDFSCSWIRAAWLMASRGKTFDQMFLERISSIKPDEMGCVLRRYLGAGGWYTLRSRHGVQGDELLMCASCTKRMSAILPSMNDEVKRISRKRMTGRPMCVFGPQNQYAASLVGDLVTAQVTVFRSRDSSIDLSRFVAKVHDHQNMREDPCGNGNTDVKEGDDDDNKEERRENRRWHIVPQLTACTVCEQCFNEVVWPELESGHPLAQKFTTNNTLGRRGSKSLHGPPYASGSSSPSPRHHDRWSRRSYHRRRRSSRHNELDDDVFGLESSYNRKPENDNLLLAIAGNGQGIRAGDKDDDDLKRICYLHSAVMRKAWQKALRMNDFGIFEAEVLRLKKKETCLRESIVQLRSLKEERMKSRYGNRLGDGFHSLEGGGSTWRNRRNSMGSIDSRPDVQPLPIADFKEDMELKNLESEWQQLGSIN